MEAGFFTVDILNVINTTRNLADAKQIAVNAITDKPDAREHNKKKALAVINQARSKTQLLISLGNFMLAHPSEGLSMEKGSK